MNRSPWQLTLGLTGVLCGLLLVGVVSHTPIRHMIQVTPIVLALGAVLSGRTWARFAALPVVIFWFLIMICIWLFLLGLARIVTGTFTPTEIALTLLIGGSCALGFWGARRGSTNPPLSQAVLTFLLFAALQVGALWLSLQPAFARR